MDECIRIKHSYNFGDLLVLMAGLRQLHRVSGKKIKLYQRLNFPAFYYEGAEHPVQSNGQQVCMNEEMFDRIWPLLMQQEYIESFEIWKGEKVLFDIDCTRDSKMIPIPYGHIHTWAWAFFPQMTCDLSEPWLEVAEKSVTSDLYSNKIVINRTSRYQNPYISYYFLKEYQDRCLFLGTEGEHSAFCSQWDLDLLHHQTDDFYQTANIIQWAKGGIYNQSAHFHLADALKKHRILEYCAAFPNTFPTGKDGYGFYHQSQLEYYFHRLLNS